MFIVCSQAFRRISNTQLGVSIASAAIASIISVAKPATASPLYFFSNGSVTNQIATASRTGPASGLDQETETADDFRLVAATRITAASFTGLIPTGVSLSDVKSVTAEIYRVFPADSDTGRAPHVPTRTNSPSDTAALKSSGSSTLSVTLLDSSFTVLNHVDTGIHPSPNQTTGGEGSFTGQEMEFDITLATPFDLPSGHFFFVPQVELSDASQHFLWLSAVSPVDASDLQSWIRNDELAPDWLRVGTDVIGRDGFNAAFTLTGSIAAVPVPGSVGLFGLSLIAFGCLHRSRQIEPRSGR